MRFHAPLLRGTLLRRYKRFLCDVALEAGEAVTAHCANPGAMFGLTEPGAEVWLSPALNPKRKLRYTWELVRIGAHLVGVNTWHPNAIVAEAIGGGRIASLVGYAGLRREVRYGANSRVDVLLEERGRPPCYVEVKNAHLVREPGLAEFPDAVTARGVKHMRELAALAGQGQRAIVFYVVQREDCQRFAIADDIDPAYGAAFGAALASGVETMVHACKLSPDAIVLDQPLALAL